MKKVWGITLGAAAFLAVILCVSGAGVAEQGKEPRLTQQLKCIVLAKTNRELVVQCTGKESTELRTVHFAKTARSGESVLVSDAVQVGDLVQLETELHSDNTETLLAMNVISASAVTQQQASAMLEGAQAPGAVAFATAPESASESSAATSKPAAKNSTAQSGAAVSDQSASN